MKLNGSREKICFGIQACVTATLEACDADPDNTSKLVLAALNTTAQALGEMYGLNGSDLLKAALDKALEYEADPKFKAERAAFWADVEGNIS